MKPRQVVFLLVLLNLATLAAGVAWGISRLRPEATAMPVQSAKPAMSRALHVPIEVRTAQVEAAPLFSSTRLPQPEPASVAPAPIVRPTPVLRGIASVGGMLGAMLEGSAGARQKLVFVGQEYDGWTVAEVGQRTVRLINGAASAELSLRSPIPGPLAASAPASSANH